MGAPKEPRKKSPKKELKYPKKAVPKENNYFTKLMQTEEGRALRKSGGTALVPQGERDDDEDGVCRRGPTRDDGRGRSGGRGGCCGAWQ